MKRISTSLLLCAAALISITSCKAQPGFSQTQLILQQQNPTPDIDLILNSPSEMQVVFVLDVTGSMGSLIQAAKDKIWSIASTLGQDQNAAKISMGIVAYRDRGDAFVTKIIDLNSDLDLVYSQLMSLRAAGGGDTPESVNQGLADAINKISWSTKQRDIRTVFLVGDCPPHMDYSDDVKYHATCKKSNQKDIAINTIQMGTHSATTPVWQEIARLGQGEYFHTTMDVETVVIATPYDDEIKRKTEQLEQTKIFYGDKAVRAEKEQVQQQKIQTLETMSESSAATRSSYFSGADFGTTYYGGNEIINDLSNGSISLDDIDIEELPEEMRDMEEDEIVNYLDTVKANRAVLEKEIEALVNSRADFVETNVSIDADASSLTNKVFNAVKIQAKKKDIKLTGKARY